MLGAVTGLAFEARDLRRGWGEGAPPVRTGLGAAAGDAAAALVDEGATSLVSFGLAGGLAPSLRPGAVLVAERLAADDHRYRLSGASDVAAPLDAVAGRLITSSTAVATPAAKRALAAGTAAVAVDMESAHVVAVAERAGVGALVVRVVADPAERRLPRLAAVAVGADGRLRPAAMLANLLRHPQDWPAVARSARDTARARAGLRRAAAGLAGLARQGLLERFLHVPLEDVLGGPLA